MNLSLQSKWVITRFMWNLKSKFFICGFPQLCNCANVPFNHVFNTEIIWILLPFVRKVDLRWLKLITQKDSVVLLVAWTLSIKGSLCIYTPFRSHYVYAWPLRRIGTPFVKLWFRKRNPLTFLSRSIVVMNLSLQSKWVITRYILKLKSKFFICVFPQLHQCNMPFKHVLLKPHEFFYHLYVKS